MDVNPVLQTIMEMAGLRLAVKRDSEVIAEVSGLKNQDPYTGRRYIALYPGADIAAGDILTDLKSQETFLVAAAEHEYVDGEWFQDRAYYDNGEETSCCTEALFTELEQENRLSDYLDYLSGLIKIKASGSSTEYESLLARLKEILSAKAIKPGSLSDFQGLLEENGWLANAIGVILTSWISRN
ncbi:hypothetical protein [Syntrophomonas curvata]